METDKTETKENILTIYLIENQYVMDYGKLSNIIKDNINILLDREEKLEDKKMKSVDVVDEKDVISYYIPLNGVEVFNLNKDEINPTFQKVGIQLSLNII